MFLTINNKKIFPYLINTKITLNINIKLSWKLKFMESVVNPKRKK